jgi:hypothetical protein
MGGGVCPINFCGELKAVSALPLNQVGQSGANTLCNGGRVCIVGEPLSSGDAFLLRCVDPVGTRPYGVACSPDPAMGMRCADDSLCVTSTDFADKPFCSQLCRNDADCPSDADGPGRCIEHERMLPNQAQTQLTVRFGMCTPKSKIKPAECLRESACPANEGCVLYGARTSLRVCKAGGPKSLGAACGNKNECRSGECFDRQWLMPNGSNRAYCSGTCVVNSDCGADQRCARLVVGNNGTPDDPLDDLVSGYCQTLFPPLAAECGASADCMARPDGSDTCDTVHGVCYKAAAVPGDACTNDAQCPLAGTCSKGPRFPSGYCQTFGCSTAATASGVDLCPGASSTCAQRDGPDEPIAGCYRGCSIVTDAGLTCPRGNEGYGCEPRRPGTPPSICLATGGT